MQLLHTQRLSCKPGACRKLTQTKEKVETLPSPSPKEQNPSVILQCRRDVFVCSVCLQKQELFVRGVFAACCALTSGGYPGAGQSHTQPEFWHTPPYRGAYKAAANRIILLLRCCLWSRFLLLKISKPPKLSSKKFWVCPSPQQLDDEGTLQGFSCFFFIVIKEILKVNESAHV